VHVVTCSVQAHAAAGSRGRSGGWFVALPGKCNSVGSCMLTGGNVCMQYWVICAGCAAHVLVGFLCGVWTAGSLIMLALPVQVAVPLSASSPHT
jgi:hypothetical protein